MPPAGPIQHHNTLSNVGGPKRHSKSEGVSQATKMSMGGEDDPERRRRILMLMGESSENSPHVENKNMHQLLERLQVNSSSDDDTLRRLQALRQQAASSPTLFASMGQTLPALRQNTATTSLTPGLLGNSLQTNGPSIDPLRLLALQQHDQLSELRQREHLLALRGFLPQVREPASSINPLLLLELEQRARAESIEFLAHRLVASNPLANNPLVAGTPSTSLLQSQASPSLLSLPTQTLSTTTESQTNNGVAQGSKPLPKDHSSVTARLIERYSAGGTKEPPFPLKLHAILCNPEYQDLITWLPHGKSWRILKPSAFEKVVIPQYFRHAKYASFMRQVNGWGFKRTIQGVEHNAYYHELFVRDCPELCMKMRRIGATKNAAGEPDDYKEDSGPSDFCGNSEA
eukprot:Nitzschia sp. Nitz4//scaffold78_size91513//50071//51382//NITZ4_004929-RA/size91513-snap-gene-0.140-mRNA-1//-1//CDS//3329558130//824//frame0